MGYGRAVIEGAMKYSAIRYPPDVVDNFLQKHGSAGRSYLPRPAGAEAHTFPHFFADDQLYNLADDPFEQINLAPLPEYTGKITDMCEVLKMFLHRLPHPFGEF